MHLKTAIFAGILAIAPTLTFAMGCGKGHSATAEMSCPVGQMLSSETNTCVPLLDATS